MREHVGAEAWAAVETGVMQLARMQRKEWCRGEMRSDHAELQLRRQSTGARLTLRHEIVGNEQD